MSSNTANRSVSRKALAALFTSALVGTGKPVQAVYEYIVGKIESSPVIIIGSSGTARQRLGIGNTKKFNNYFAFEVFTFVRDADEKNGWTEAMVEDQLDLVDKAIADVVGDNLVNANWLNISFDISPDNPVPSMSEIFTDTERGYKGEMRKIYIQRND